MMKVVYIIFSISKLTGIEKMFVTQMNYLADHCGYDVTLLTYDQGKAPDGYPLSARVRHIDYNIKTFHVFQYPLVLRPFILRKWHQQLGKLIRNTIQEIAPDIVVCSSYESIEMEIVLSLKHVKRVVQVHSSYLQSGGTLRSRHIENTVKLWYKKLFLFPRVIRQVRSFDSIIVLTQGDAALWHSDRVRVIPNPLVVAVPQGKVVREKKIIAVGSLLMVKGFDMLLEAWDKIFRRHPDWLLEITGEGIDRPYLEQQMQTMQNVRILPNTHDIASRYMSGEIFVMTSRYEGFGLALLEAMSFGLAPVAFDCDFGPREIISEGHDGFLVPVGNIDLLSERLEYLMNNEAERHTMGARAIEKSRQFQVDKVLPKFYHLYESLIESDI